MLLDSYGYLKRRIYSVNFSLSLVAKKKGDSRFRDVT